MTSRRLTLPASIIALGIACFFAGRYSRHHDSFATVKPHQTPLAAVAPRAEGAGALPSADRKSESARLARAVSAPRASLREEEERQHLLEQWAEVDPRAALAYARTQLRGDHQAQAISSVLTIWGKNDPAAAWTWVKTEMPQASNHFDTLLEVFGRNSPEIASKYADEYSAQHPAASLETHMAALLGVTYTGDFAAARAMVAGNPLLDENTRSTLNNFIAGQWARFDPTRAADWVMSLPAGDERNQALIGLGESWSDVDPAKATGFAVNLPEGETRTLALRQAISKWVVVDPVAARNWVLNTDRHEDFDQAVQAVATETNLMSRDPSRALLWADGIFDNTLRQQTQSTILFNWYASDPQAATDYIKSSTDFNPEQRNAILKKLKPSI